MKKYLLCVVLFISISLCGCNNGSDAAAEDILPNVSDDIREGDLVAVGETWEESYKSIICDIDSNLADPYNYNFGFNGNVYLGIHDFNNDDIPELIIGNSVSAAVFTYENGNAVKVADLYEPEEWGGINGLYYKDNHIVLVNSGSGGSGYVCFTYDEGEYVIGVYDDYNPDKGVINGNQVTGEVFRQQFNLAELTNNSRIEYSKINEEDGLILMVNGESITIDNLDFQLLEWQDNMPVSKLTEKTTTNEVAVLGTAPELRAIMFGEVVNLGIGTLAYTVPANDDEDYRLYFFMSKNEKDRYQSLSEMNFNLSTVAYVFPDVRNGNASIGEFKEIYCLETTDILQDGTEEVIVIAIYEKDRIEYYDTRVYEASENGYVVNIELTQELNEKYYNVENYPIQEVISLSSDHE
ncbi:MAG: hypothetical protein J1D87_12125 [Lachnospiraceae bacterium]|nr:hypothetical protein [Lachnospiraceae bacterium]